MSSYSGCLVIWSIEGIEFHPWKVVLLRKNDCKALGAAQALRKHPALEMSEPSLRLTQRWCELAGAPEPADSWPPEARDDAEAAWRRAEDGLPAVLVEHPDSPFLLWGRAARAPLAGPGRLCLLSHLWPLRDQWLRYCHCFRGFLKQPDITAWASPITPTTKFYTNTAPKCTHSAVKGTIGNSPSTAREAPWSGVSLNETLKTAWDTLKTPKPVSLIQRD